MSLSLMPIEIFAERAANVLGRPGATQEELWDEIRDSASAALEIAIWLSSLGLDVHEGSWIRSPDFAGLYRAYVDASVDASVFDEDVVGH